MKREGKDIIGLHVGEPDLDIPENMFSGLEIIAKKNHGYISGYGYHPLREKIAEHENVPVDNIMIIPGSKFGIYLALKVLKKKVTIPVPAWPAYRMICESIGLEYIETELFSGDDEIRGEVVILNTPHNPTSSMIKRNVRGDYVILDSAYDKLSFNEHILPEIRGKLIKISSFSKSAGITGARIGYIVACNDIIDRMRKEMSITLTCVPSFIQEWILRKFELIKDFSKNAAGIYEERADMAYGMLKDDFDVIRPEAGFYIFPKVGDGDHVFRKLLDENIAVLPGSLFNNPENIRISLVKEQHILKYSLDKLKKIAKSQK